jgi:S-adenosylmethionine decarboxylase proenzyme
LKGKHLILDCYGITCEAANDAAIIKSFLNRLVEKIDMEIFHGPVVKVCNDIGNEGVSGFVMITTSHISIHTWPIINYISFDCYSCKDFDESIVIAEFEDIFKPKYIVSKVVERKSTI